MNALEKYSLLTHITVVIGLILFLIMIIFYWPFNISSGDERSGWWLLAGFARWVFGILSLGVTIWLILEIDEQVKDILAS